MIRLGRAATWLLMLAPLAAAAVSSCKVVHGTTTTTGQPTGTTGSGGSGGAGTSSTSTTTAGSGGDPEVTGRAIFTSTVQTEMLSECGGCHELGGPADVPFLAAPDIYVSITTWPGIIVSPADTSIILTHPGDPSHGGGQAPNLSPALRAAVTKWLDFEAAHLPMVDAGLSPHLPPFKPSMMGAFNAVVLDSLGMAFDNAAITFYAEELGDPPSLLSLTNIQVHPVQGVDIHLVHPLFTVFPAEGGAIPDPADSFSGFDETFDIAGDPTFGTGALILSHWEKDAFLGINFESVDAIQVGGPAATCKDEAKFEAEVVPLLTMFTVPCLSCHGTGSPDGGAPNIQAQQQMDLTNIAAMPPDDACTQMRARITPGDPDTSQILIVTDPSQGAVHLFKFLGNKNNYNNFKMAVSPWILAEQ